MGLVGKILKAIGSPIGILEDWASEPLKRWEHKRQEETKDSDVERRIREQTGVEEVKARVQRENASHQARLDRENASQKAELEIRMQTEIIRLNAETEQWSKDKEFERMKNVADAIATYQERLTTLNLTTVRAIGEMDIELRSKAQALILEKTQEYRQIQNQATKDAEEEFERILDKFGSNERIMNIMIGNSDKKLASIINSTTKFLEELSVDIQNMNKNIDHLIKMGHEHTLRQLDKLNSSANPTINQISQGVQDVNYKEIEQ